MTTTTTTTTDAINAANAAYAAYTIADDALVLCSVTTADQTAAVNASYAAYIATMETAAAMYTTIDAALVAARAAAVTANSVPSSETDCAARVAFDIYHSVCSR